LIKKARIVYHSGHGHKPRRRQPVSFLLDG
jgi:hypothetical protein